MAYRNGLQANYLTGYSRIMSAKTGVNLLTLIKSIMGVNSLNAGNITTIKRKGNHMQKPRRKQVRDETFRLLTAHGATGWKVRYNSRLTRALGRCIPSQKTIEYQPKFMDLNDWDEVVMTIRHEVAHALSPRWEGHGAIWRAKCIELGGNGKQYNSTATIGYKFTGTCQGCDTKVQRNRRAQGVIHSACYRLHQAGDAERKYSIVWTRND